MLTSHSAAANHVGKKPGPPEQPLPEARWNRWDAAYLVLLAILPVALFWPEVAGTRVFDSDNLWQCWYPYRQLVIEAWRAGQAPWWNPNACAGMPLSADGQTAIYYPLSWLSYLMPVPHAICASEVIHFALAGIGMFVYCRSLRIRGEAAAIGAIAFCLNGFLAVRTGYQGIMAGAALVPWLFWTTDRLLSRGSILPLAIAIAAMVFCGHPQIPAYAGLGALIYVGIDAASRRQWSALPRFAGAAVLGLAISAAHWLPMYELARLSPRAAGASYDFVAGNAMRWFDWLLYLFPYAYGGPQLSLANSAVHNPYANLVNERLAYIGLMPLMLALYAVVMGLFVRNQSTRLADSNNDTRPVTVRLLIIAIVMVLIASGDQTPFGHLFYAIPVIGKFRDMSRATTLLSFCLCVLSAIGAQPLLTRRRVLPAAPIVCGLIILTAVLATLLIEHSLAADRTSNLRMHEAMMRQALRLDQSNGYLPLIFAAGGAGMMVLLSLRPHRITATLALALIGADVGIVAISYQPTVDPAVFDAIPPAAQFLRQQAGVFRVVNLCPYSYSLTPQHGAAALLGSWAMRFGLEDINGNNSLQTRRNLDLVASPENEDITYGGFENPQRLDAGRPLAGLFNVKYALAPTDCGASPPRGWAPVYRDSDVTIFQNSAVVPRAHFVDQVSIESDPARELAAVTDDHFNPAVAATVDRSLSPSEAAALSHADASDTVRLVDRTFDTIRLTADCGSPRLVVISQSYFPGWKATLDPDGPAPRALPVLRVDYDFCAIALPAGSHAVRMEYRPASVLVGLFVSGGTIVCCCVVAGLRRGGRQQGGADA